MVRAFCSLACLAVILLQGFANPSSAALGGSIASSPLPPAVSPLVVRLQRVEGGNRSHFYVGRISIGKPEPQEFRVLFDTASGHVLLPHVSCKSEACEKHQHYAPRKSGTSTDINANGEPVQSGQHLVQRDSVTLEFSQADLGEGSAKAVIVRDQVCLGTEFSGQVCTDVDVMAAIRLEDQLFHDMPYDGMLGLGMAGLATESNCVFFNQLIDSTPGLLPEFGLLLGAQSGEIFFGGHDPSRLAAPIEWFPVLHPSDGFWEVEVKAVRLGNMTVDSCTPACRGIVDTGASRLGVQDYNFERLKRALASSASTIPGGGCRGGDLEFDLGSMKLTLRVEDYAAGASCEPQLGPLELDSNVFNGVYAFGESILRRYYTAFDWQGRRIGFAPAAPRRVHIGSGFKKESSAEQVFTV